ncbi:MAG: single-stranded DNA-binding protein [Clostridia bacterium]|nr:single-stranded DNA-binding protein [Clostridia bacterium]
MANFNLNKVMLGGRLATQPELKQTQSGIAVTSFLVAVNRPKAKDGENAADFINVTAWREQAEFVDKYFDKGNSIFIEGTINTRTWTDKDGGKRKETEVIAQRVSFVDSKGETHSDTYVPESYTAPAMEDIDGDLPF